MPQLVVTYHSDVVRQRRLGMVLRPFEHLVFRRAAAILSESPGLCRRLATAAGLPQKVRVLPFGD